MYCIVKRCWKVLELSHYFCVKIFVTVTFIISIQQKSGKLWAWASCYWICRCYVFVLGPYPLQFKDVCIQNGHSVWLFVNGQTIFFKKNPVDCLVWESSQFPECSCLLTEDPQSETPSQDQCLCQRACKHLHTVHRSGSAQHGFGTASKSEVEVFSWKYCLHLFLYILSVPPTPLPLPPGTIKSKKKKNFQMLKWYIWGNVWEI